MKRRPILAATAVAVALSFSLAASAKFVGIGDNDVKFLAVGPAGMKINGTGDKLKAKEKDGKITVSVPLSSLETGIGLRDKHLKKYLHAGDHPDAILVVERRKLKEPADKKTIKGSATGDFTLNGKTKPVRFRYKAKRTGSDYHVQGRATIDIRDFDIEVPCYLGVCVKPNVKIAVKFKLRDQ